MPPPHPRLPSLSLLQRRLFSTAQPRPYPGPGNQKPPSQAPETDDDNDDSDNDFYALLLSQPLAHPSPTSISQRAALQASNSLSDSSSNSPPITTTTTIKAEPQPAPEPAASPAPKISFSMPLAGPSARMRGLARAERGLDRPPEPDNCCMSGCVNCVWEAYREEVEEWALAKRRRERAEEKRRLEGMRRHADVRYVGRGREEEEQAAREVEEGGGGGIGELDAIGGGEVEEEELDSEGLFDEVPVGMREFMATEKRLRERKQRRLAVGEG